MRVKSLGFALSVILVITLAFTVAHTQAAQVRAAWNAPTNANGTPVQDLAGYTLYYWQADWDAPASVDVGNRITYTLEDLEEGETYFFAVTASDTSGNESVYSNIEDYTIPADDPPPDPSTAVVFAVNAGGPQYVDANGTLYRADTRFTGGRTYTRQVAIADTQDDVLYQTVRYGDFSYAIPLHNGNYVVTLQFAEIYWATAGKRVFDVKIEGTEVLSNLDLVAKVGAKRAYDVAVPVRVHDGVLNISFHTNRDNAMVNAIVVEAEEGTP